MENSKPEQQNKEVSFLKEIMAISGYPGLYRFISQARNGIIVESLEDKKRMQAFSNMKVSALEEIAVYAGEEEIPLAKVLRMIYDKESGGETISYKSDPESMKKYFAEVLPEYDRERVYISDIKKILNWYNILRSHDLLKFEEDKQAETNEADVLPAKEKETVVSTAKKKETDVSPAKGTKPKKKK